MCFYFRQKRSSIPWLSLAFAAALLIGISSSIVLRAAESVLLHGKVTDEDGKPVEDIEVRIQSPGNIIRIAHTDASGAFEFSGADSGEYFLSLNKSGFFRISSQSVILKPGDNEVSFTIAHETEIHEEVEVYSSSESINPSATSHSDIMIAREIRDVPVPTTHDLRSSLRTMPDVVQDHAGQLHIAGGRTGESQYLLDGFDIGDPVTGDFSVRVNVDSVRAAEVESGRYSIQNGYAGAGVLSLDTAAGDDRWRVGATNFVPGVSIQNGLHMTSWYPRFTLSGPLHRERAWFSEALSIQRTLSLVEGLPDEEDSVTQWAGDNMFRTQVKLTPQNILHGNFLFNKMKANNLGLAESSPISTTRKLRETRSFFSLKDQVWSGRTFYELGMAADFSDRESLPHGSEPYQLTPNGSAGNYFESLWQKTRRWQAVGSMSMPTRHLHGTHDLQFGFSVAALQWDHTANRNTIEVVRADHTLVQRTSFSGKSKFDLDYRQTGIYGNDVWHASGKLIVSLGLRMDWNNVVNGASASPRVSANFLPFKNNSAKLSASWGIFLQPVTLSNLGPAHDQERLDIFYDSTGTVPVLGPAVTRFALSQNRLQQPRFYTTTLGWTQNIGSNSQAEASFTRRNGNLGLAYEKTAVKPPDNRYILQNSREDHYRSIQFSLRHSFNDKTAVSGSYTRSSTLTNRVFDYSLDTVVFTPQEPGPLDWDAPNRLISSGWAPAPLWDLTLSYFFEYRTGFPFSVINEQQQLVGPANHMRFPDYASLNFGVEKRVRLFTRNWAIRLTILNVTGHSNWDNVINNVDSPLFLKYNGVHKTSLNARIRLVG